MSKKLLAAGLGSLLLAGMVMAGPLKGHPNMKRAHKDIKGAIHDMEMAQKANEYDLGGHAAKAEQLMRQAEQEITAAAATADENHK